MKSIKLKLVIMYLALVFIVMIISGTFMLVKTQIEETNKIYDALRRYAISVEDQVIQVYSREKFQDGIITLPRGTSKIDAHILNLRGETIASTVSIDMKFENTAIISALTGSENYTSGKDADITGVYREWINYAYPINDDEGNVRYVVYTQMDAEPIFSSLLDQATTLSIAVVIALTLAGLLGFLFANTITGPIILLTKKSKEMALGNLEQKIEVRSKDEIGQLTESFNDMASELSRSMAGMASERNKMSILLHNMSDGVLAYDRNGELIHANFSCQELLNSVDIEGIPFSEMMELLGAKASTPESISFDSLEDTVLELGDRFISSSFAPYYNNSGRLDGLVIVLQDITKHRRLDDMRKEFVANVSHELRTPLTTVKSYTETLLNGALDDRETAIDFLSVVEQEANRMAYLVQDLLELSRFDNMQLKITTAPGDLIDIMKQCIRQTTLLAQNKNQTIVFEPPGNEYRALIDESRINQVFTNIISNAIKYSPEGSTIKIIAEETDKYYRIYIKDEGIGIPKEDLRRIFERFYRVDKARSRAMGGTGLGLAIAKEIIDAHNGKIFAASEFGKGTTMIIRLNKVGLDNKEIDVGSDKAGGNIDKNSTDIAEIAGDVI